MQIGDYDSITYRALIWVPLEGPAASQKNMKSVFLALQNAFSLSLSLSLSTLPLSFTTHGTP